MSEASPFTDWCKRVATELESMGGTVGSIESLQSPDAKAKFDNGLSAENYAKQIRTRQSPQYISTTDTAPALFALSNILICGFGSFLLGQRAKALFLLALAVVVGLISQSYLISFGFLGLVAVDTFCVCLRVNRGETVSKWQFF